MDNHAIPDAPTAAQLFEQINDDVLDALIAGAEWRKALEPVLDLNGTDCDYFLSVAEILISAGDCPPKPVSITISESAFMLLVRHEGPLLVDFECSNGPPLYRLKGCGLPLHRDFDLTGYEYRLSDEIHPENTR